MAAENKRLDSECGNTRHLSGVVITAIICATVIFLSIMWLIFAVVALNKSSEIVKDLPKDLRTVNITVIR